MAGDDVVDGEPSLGAEELSLEDHLKEEIAELLAQSLPVAGVDGVDHLARFLEHVLAERLERLLAVPGAAARREELPHDAHEPDERGAVLLCDRGHWARDLLVELGEGHVSSS